MEKCFSFNEVLEITALAIEKVKRLVEEVYKKLKRSTKENRMAATSTASPFSPTPTSYGGGSTPSFINAQPITKNSIIRYNRRIVDPYRGKKEPDPTFIPVAEKIGGTAIGTIYEKQATDGAKPPKRYLAHIYHKKT